MHGRSKVSIIISPSFLSGIICIVLSIVIMLVMGFSYNTGKGSVYNYLFGPGSSSDIIGKSSSGLSAFNNVVLGNAIINKILYFAFWMMVGLIVYIMLYALLKGTGDAANDLKQTRYTNASRNQILHDFAIKLAVRVTAICAWVS